MAVPIVYMSYSTEPDKRMFGSQGAAMKKAPVSDIIMKNTPHAGSSSTYPTDRTLGALDRKLVGTY